MAQQNEPLVQPEELDMPDDEVLYELADLFRVFGDSTCTPCTTMSCACRTLPTPCS